MLYHRHLPTAIVSAADHPLREDVLAPNHPLLPRHVRAHKVNVGPSDDAVTGRHLLFGNVDVRVLYVVATETSPLYRNGIGDEVLYVESGSGVVETIFGALTATSGDYVVLPTSTTYRVVPDAGEPLRLLVVEARGHIGPPARYLSKRGQFLEHAPFCERDLKTPTSPLLVDGEDVPVLVRHQRGVTRYVYAHHPFDVVGWDGGQYPYTFSIHDFEPITGRVHQPPTVHQTFAKVQDQGTKNLAINSSVLCFGGSSGGIPIIPICLSSNQDIPPKGSASLIRELLRSIIACA